MKKISLCKLTKDELIELINRHDHKNKISRDASLVYFDSRGKKNNDESLRISKLLDINLEKQSVVIPEFNNCKDIDKKMKIGRKLNILLEEYKKLCLSWEKVTKNGNKIFSESV